MDIQEIKNKLAYAIQINSELPELELKAARNNVPKDIWKSISAFSQRRGGGGIVFGVKENPYEIIGCNNIELIQRKLLEYFNDKMSYILRPAIYVEKYDQDRTIVAVYVPECPKEYRPCYFKPVGLPFGAYIREGNSNRTLTDNEFRTYVATSKEFQFDQSEAPNSSIDDLSENKIRELLLKKEEELNRGAVPEITNELLKNIGVAGEYENSIKPTYAGVLIFSKDLPQKKQPFDRYTIRCVKYSGNDCSGDILDKLDVQGTLDNQIDQSYSFILKNIRKAALIKGTKRYEKYEYPEQAIREIIANAVIHRDYKIIETFTHINIFQDRLEISNPGNLPPGVTVQNIKDAQFSRNVVIASRLKDLKYLEEYGRGIDIVFNRMKEWGLQPPLFRNSVNNFQVILLGEKFSGINERQRVVIYNLMLKGKITVKDCLKILKGVSRITVNRDLKSLKNLGLINQQGTSTSLYYTLGL